MCISAFPVNGSLAITSNHYFWCSCVTLHKVKLISVNFLIFMVDMVKCYSLVDYIIIKMQLNTR